MKAHKSYRESLDEIKARVSNADLLSHYLGINTLPVLINSPLRDDRHPSFFIFSPDGNKVCYKDFASGDKGDIYSLLQKKYSLSFSELIKKIASEKSFEHSNILNKGIKTMSKKFFTKPITELQVKVRQWEKHDIEYWESYGISLQWLKFADIYPISHKIIYKNNTRYVFHAAKYAYVFVERKENNVSLKVYQPLVKDKRYKWANNNNASVVGLWTKMPAIGDKLVICSSLKDALCLRANIGLPTIYVQSETTGLSETAQKVLKSRFKNIYICFDNDPPGLKDGEKLAGETGFKNIIIPQFTGGKDISDAYKVKGKEEFIKMFKPLFE
jgi:hypothetical protein